MRKMLVLIAFALPLAANAQSYLSHSQQRDAHFCRLLADSTSFVVAETNAGASDAEIEAKMRALDMLPLTRNTREVAEQNAHGLDAGDVLAASYDTCVQSLAQ
jgi:hypothetical protein